MVLNTEGDIKDQKEKVNTDAKADVKPKNLSNVSFIETSKTESGEGSFNSLNLAKVKSTLELNEEFLKKQKEKILLYKQKILNDNKDLIHVQRSVKYADLFIHPRISKTY